MASEIDTSAEAYLIMKRGLYYGPKKCGYTGIKDKAGRYTKEQAEALTHPNGPDGPRDDLSFLPVETAPDFSPACYDDLRADHLVGKVRALEAERDVAQSALRAREEEVRLLAAVVLGISPDRNTMTDEASEILLERACHIARTALATPAPDTYPEGVTQADHIAHDMRAGRFPKQSSVQQFLRERERDGATPAPEDAA